jgi:hypothetical protein
MTKLGRMVALVTFTLGLLTPAGQPKVLAADNDPPLAPRGDHLGTTQRGEDPLQAPRGEGR